MNLEYLIARRTAIEDRASRSSVMMRIALFAVAMGVAVMILSLAVIAGFRNEIYSTLRGFGADISLTHYTALGHSEPERVQYDSLWAEELRAMPAIKSVGSYATMGCMAKSGENVVGLSLKGIGVDYPSEWWESRIVEGSLPDVRSGSRRKEILLSERTAQLLGLKVGDKVEMLFMEGERPRRDRLKIAGLYATGFEEVDRVVALVDIRDLRRIGDWGENEITGYDIMLHDKAQSEAAAEQIALRSEESESEAVWNLSPMTLREREPVTFDWLKAHNINAQVIIVILICVLLFNMASAVLIMVLDRRATIGLLKAQGMRSSHIRRIFIFRSALLLIKGLAWGNAIALSLAWVQHKWHVVELSAEGYMLNYLPVEVEWWSVVALNAGVIVVTLAMMLLPSQLISRISPAESLKYKQ